MGRKVVLALIVIGGFILAELCNRWFDFPTSDNPTVSALQIAIERLLWYLGLPMLVLWGMHGRRTVLSELGLNNDIRKPALLALLACSPMFIGYGWAANFSISLDVRSILLGVIVAALVEEVYFRGFLFGQLYRQVGLWFLPAAILSAMVFATAHLYQSSEPAEAAGIFAVTLIGGIWFGWLWIRSAYNLWLPIFMHGLMNLSWSIFSVDDNALGGVEANIYRVLTIALSIWLTITTYPESRKRN